jgi:hypothetical protein
MKKLIRESSCAHHLCKGFLTDFGNCNFGLSVLTEVSQQEKNTSKSFLAGIEKLVNQILFVSDVPCQQICHEHIGKSVPSVKHFHHGLLIDSHHRCSKPSPKLWIEYSTEISASAPKVAVT